MSNEKKTVRFAVIGCGLMGREFACAAARWCQLSTDIPKPVIVGVCDLSEDARRYFTDNFDTVKYSTTDYHELLAAEDIDAVYCAVPHNLHKQFYVDIINAGKHLLGEKPFGIDKEDNAAILEAIKAHPEVVVRCSGEFPFFPGENREFFEHPLILVDPESASMDFPSGIARFHCRSVQNNTVVQMNS